MAVSSARDCRLLPSSVHSRHVGGLGRGSPPSILDLTVGSSLFPVFPEITWQEGVDSREGHSVSSTRNCLKIHPLPLCLARDRCRPLPQQGWPCDGSCLLSGDSVTLHLGSEARSTFADGQHPPGQSRERAADITNHDHDRWSLLTAARPALTSTSYKNQTSCSRTKSNMQIKTALHPLRWLLYKKKKMKDKT